MHPLIATSYDGLQGFLLWGCGWLVSLVFSLLAFAFSCSKVPRKSWVVRLSCLSLSFTAFLTAIAWLPILYWHPNDRAAMLRGVMFTPWLPLVSLFVIRLRGSP